MARPVVMIVEDDVEMRRLLCAVVRGVGVEVVEAADGDEATARLTRWIAAGRVEVPDLVITDVRLPGCSGLDLLATFRQWDRATPVVVITAFGDQETHAVAYGLGAAKVLDKPFDLDELRRVVRRLVPSVAV